MKTLQRTSCFFAVLASCGGLAPTVHPSASAQDDAVDPIRSSVLFRLRQLSTNSACSRFNDVASRLNRDEEGTSLEVQVKTASPDTANPCLG